MAPGSQADAPQPARACAGGVAIRHVVIVGLMAVGKSTVGRALARSLRWPMSDSDDEIGAREGLSARALQDRRGAAALHALEARVLLDALAGGRHSVICAAASTVADPDCRAALADASVFTVWLRASVSTLLERYEADPHRPHYPEGTEEALHAQLGSRAGYLASVARVAIDVDGHSPAQVAARIAALIAASD